MDTEAHMPSRPSSSQRSAQSPGQQRSNESEQVDEPLPPSNAIALATDLAEQYRAVRQQSVALCSPLAIEDYVIQTMPDVSPTKWHLAHSTWFFETLILKAHLANYRPHDPQYERLFNSYYNTIGLQHCRPKRGLLSRPTVQDVFAYREHVDRNMTELLQRDELPGTLRSLIEIGLHHEQQHQELILTDIKHVLASNVLRAVYGGRASPRPAEPISSRPAQWISHDEGVQWIGHDASSSTFAYDNESPRHRAFLEAFQIAARLVTCGEYLAFMEDGGYQRPELWLSDGWRIVQEQGWGAPLYWQREDGQWSVFTLAGRRAVDHDEPVCHVSFYEADAYARWCGARLPSEAEWEVIARDAPMRGNFMEDGHFHPIPSQADHNEADVGEPVQLFGDVWEWTASPYQAYPGYAPPQGALGEYNSKFMCNQMVLRGGSCATPASHMRPTYRNFFPPEARWQFSGIRLSRTA